MSADNYYLVRKHPLGGFTYVMGFASDVDDDDNEIVPEATVSDPRFDTKEAAMSACMHEYAEYGYDYHWELCEDHKIEWIWCETCGDSDEFCRSCDYFKGHL